MTHQDFLQWIDSEIAYMESISLTEFGDGRLSAFKRSREKFLTIEYPQQETEPKEFTDGL
jgi:hypothetical protein